MPPWARPVCSPTGEKIRGDVGGSRGVAAGSRFQRTAPGPGCFPAGFGELCIGGPAERAGPQNVRAETPALARHGGSLGAPQPLLVPSGVGPLKDLFFFIYFSPDTKEVTFLACLVWFGLFV